MYKILISLTLVALGFIFNPISTIGAADGEACTDFLRLVNREHPLPSSYQPKSLYKLKNVYKPKGIYKPKEVVIQAEAHKAFESMMADMAATGLPVPMVQSGYRCHRYQQAIFDQKVKELTAKGLNKAAATEKALASVQPPGASEHQLGLAIDVTLDGTLSQAFGQTPTGQWLAENSHRHGFIIRYPQGKTHITGIVYEPWHLRYVGLPHSSIMEEKNLTLEEYLHYLQTVGRYVFWLPEGEYFLIEWGEPITTTRKKAPPDYLSPP